MMKGEVLVLGAGKMTEAILVGLKQSTDLSNFRLFSPSGLSAEKLALKVGAKSITSLDTVNPEWILLGCKPQQINELKKIIGDKFNDKLFVSMLAALPEAIQLQKLGAKRLIRIMPNLPVRFKKGVTLLSSESAKIDLKAFNEVFSRVGLAQNVSEAELEELTLLTGSGPAFFYEFAKDLAQGFTSLDEAQREKLARAVLLGSGLSAEQSSESLQDMINAVTSKGGVTIATLENFRMNKFSELIKKGIEAGKKRSQEVKELIVRS